jgi:hypothetical protein
VSWRESRSSSRRCTFEDFNTIVWPSASTPRYEHVRTFLIVVPGRQSTSALKASRAMRKLANGRSGGDAKLHGEYYKALDKDPKTRVFLADVLGGFWESGSFPDGEIPAGPTPAVEPTLYLGVISSGRSAICRPVQSGPNSAGCRRRASFGTAATKALPLFQPQWLAGLRRVM